MTPPMSGLIAAPHTPMSPNGGVNHAMVASQADLLIESGVIGAFIGGTTGESSSLTLDERVELANSWVNAAQGRLKIFVHVGHHCIQEAQELAKHAQSIGADGTAAYAPSYFKPATVSALVGTMALIAQSAPKLPFYYYEIPCMTGISLPALEFLRLADQQIPNLRGMKFSDPDLVTLMECIRFNNQKYEMLFGCDEMLLPAMAIGIQAAVGSTYNFIAPVYHRIIQAFQDGDWQTAQNEQAKSIAVVRTLANFGFGPAAKHLMSFIGVDCGNPRLPLLPLDPKAKSALWDALVALDDQDQPVFSRPLRTSGG